MFAGHIGDAAAELGPSIWVEIGQSLLGTWRLRDLEREVEPLEGGLARAVELAVLTRLVCSSVPGLARSVDGRGWFALLCLDADCKKRPIPRVEEHVVAALTPAELKRAAREFRAGAEVLAQAVGVQARGRTWEEELDLAALEAEALRKSLDRLERMAGGRMAQPVAELAMRAAHLVEGLERVVEGD